MPSINDDDTLIGEDAPRSDARRPDELRSHEAGAALGRYVILRQLGRGGMGVVYAAYDPQLDRKVALKLLHAAPRSSAESGASEGAPRLLREAQALAKLAHPNVITVHDVGTVDEGAAVFLAMEFIAGETLGEWSRREPRSWREILTLYGAAGRGLAAAHRAGIVHRDFKPDNVMIGGDGRPRVLDFGLARALGDEDGPRRVEPSLSEVALTVSRTLDDKLTVTGAVMGTPAYMAPEQHEGRAVDARTDQFAFCVALYEALYGERPFAGDNPMALLFNVTLGKIREPSEGRELPSWLRKVLVRGLAVNPDDRYPDMEALLEALAADPARRRRSLGLGLAAVVVVAGLGAWAQALLSEDAAMCTGAEAHLVGVWDPPTRAALAQAFHDTGVVYADDAFAGLSAGLDDYSRRWVAMHRQACEATRIHGEQTEAVMTLRMACLDDGLARLAALVEVYRSVDAESVERAVEAGQSLPSLEACADVDGLLLGVAPPSAEQAPRVEALRRRLDEARALAAAGRRARASELLTPLVDEIEAADYRPLIAEAQLSYGQILEVPAQQIAAIERALWAAEASRHDRLAAEGWLDLARIRSLGAQDIAGGEAALERADAAIERLGGEAALRVELEHARGTVLSADGREQEAVVAFRRAAEARRAAGLDEGTTALREAVDLGNALMSVGDVDEAEPLLRESLTRAEALLGPDHPRVARLRATLGRAQYMRKDYSAAEASLREALAITERTHGPDSPQVAGMLNGLAVVYGEQGKFEDALACYRRAGEIFRGSQGPRHINYARVLCNQAFIEKELGQDAQALANIDACVAIHREQERLDASVCWNLILAGEVLVAQGRLDEAEARYRESDALLEDRPEPDTRLRLLASRAELALARGQLDEALRLLAQGEALREAGVNDTTFARHDFIHAGALWQAGEPQRARELARRARQVYGEASLAHARRLAEVDAWLADHGEGPSEGLAGGG